MKDLGNLGFGNIHGVAIGKRITCGRRGRNWCVQVYVYHKLPKTRLRKNHIIPGLIDGLPVDVVEMPPFNGLPGNASHCVRQRPLRPGACAALKESAGAGTLGCFCRPLQGAAPGAGVYALSNNHVFADYNHGNADGDPVLQPPEAHDGTMQDRIGVLHDFVPLKPPGETNVVDAAISTVDAGVSFDRLLPDGSSVSATTQAAVGDRVVKFGARTGRTQGTVVSIHASVDVHHAGVGTYRFVQQIIVEGDRQHLAFAQKGDSGALVVEQADGAAPRAIGLLHGASTTGMPVADEALGIIQPGPGSGIVCPIDFVLSGLGIELA